MGSLGPQKHDRYAAETQKLYPLHLTNRIAFSRGRTTGSAIDGDGVGRG